MRVGQRAQPPAEERRGKRPQNAVGSTLKRPRHVPEMSHYRRFPEAHMGRCCRRRMLEGRVGMVGKFRNRILDFCKRRNHIMQMLSKKTVEKVAEPFLSNAYKMLIGDVCSPRDA